MRLTERTGDELSLNCNNCPMKGKCSDSLDLIDCAQVLAYRLAAYEDAEEQGLLVRLPCKDDLKIVKTETFVENDIFVGETKVGTVEVCPERNEITRLMIFEPYQNKGYGTTVVKLLVDQGYDKLWVRSDNEPAIHVYKKCGFQTGEKHMFEMHISGYAEGGET